MERCCGARPDARERSMSLVMIGATKALSVVAGVAAAYLWWKASGVPPPAPGAAFGAHRLLIPSTSRFTNRPC
jgi:hypothetical protein